MIQTNYLTRLRCAQRPLSPTPGRRLHAHRLPVRSRVQ